MKKAFLRAAEAACVILILCRSAYCAVAAEETTITDVPSVQILPSEPVDHETALLLEAQAEVAAQGLPLH